MSQKNELNYLIHFKSQMLKFLDELMIIFPHEPSFIIIRIFVNDKIPVKDVIGRFMLECLPVSRALKERNDKFFIYSDFIYEKYAQDVGEDEINNFKKIWESEVLDDENKDVIWRWLDMFMLISRRYYDTFGCVEDWEFNLEKDSDRMNRIIYPQEYLEK
jgi:hypothetical protein